MYLTQQQDLELVTNKPTADNQELQDNSAFESQLSVAQIIYSDNKVSHSSIQIETFDTKTL